MSQTEEGIAFPLWHRIRAAVLVEVEVGEVGEGDAFSNQLELDHPVPLRDYGGNEQTLVPLCNACHSHKSYLGSTTPFQENPIASVFEKSVFQAFHDSPKPKQAVQQIHNPANTQAVEIDTIRCRRNAFDQNMGPIPIFSN